VLLLSDNKLFVGGMAGVELKGKQGSGLDLWIRFTEPISSEDCSEDIHRSRPLPVLSVPDLQLNKRDEFMNQDSKPNYNHETVEETEMLDEYNFSKAVRRKSSQQRTDMSVTIDTENRGREVKIKTIEVSSIVSEDHTLTIQLPSDITPGSHRIVLLIEESES
jgi:hypothetical protein